MSCDEFEAKTAQFLTWLENNGVRLNPKMQLADLRSQGRGRGVVAVDNFDEDEIVFSIPRKALLNITTALPRAEVGLRSAISSMPNWLALTTLMVLESSYNDSHWAPYFAFLPQQLESLIFWSDRELAELQASTVVNKIGKEKAEELFAHQIALLGLKNYEVETCHRVASIIMAYAFDIPEQKQSDMVEDGHTEEREELVSDDEEDEKIILSMIPLADMLNADADRNNARLCCDNEELEMRTIKPITKGEEIYNDYGQLPRSDLLRRYGYVTDQYAPYDVAEISGPVILKAFSAQGAIILSNGCSLAALSQEEVQARVDLAEREGVYEESYDLAHAGDDGPSIPDELLALVFVLLVDKENLTTLVSSESALPSRSKLATELVGQVLVALLRLREAEYATTLEEDEQELQQENLGGRKAMALKVRHGEKVVLREAIQEASSFSGSNKRMRAGKDSEVGKPLGKAKRKASPTSITNGKKQRSR